MANALIVILIIANIVLVAMFIGVLITTCKGESKNKKDIKHANELMAEHLACTQKHLFDLLNSKTIRYKGRIFEIKHINICAASNSAVLVELTDKLGFTKTVDIKDITINEKE